MNDKLVIKFIIYCNNSDIFTQNDFKNFKKNLNKIQIEIITLLQENY